MFEDFVRYLWQGGAYGYYHVLPSRRSVWQPTDAQQWRDPTTLETRGNNVYFGVHPCVSIPTHNALGEPATPAAVRGQAPLIAAINCLYAEFDQKDYGSRDAIIDHITSAVFPMPSVMVTSGAGVHGYWLLDQTYTLDTDAKRKAAAHVQRGWVGVVGGDKSVNDLPRILRVPGTHNYKYDPAPEVEWLHYSLDTRYPITTLTAHLPPAPVETRKATYTSGPSPDIAQFNADNDIADVLKRYGYRRRGQYRMISPWSGTGRDGVLILRDGNRAKVFTGGDPLSDGYSKKPFDVVKVLGFDGDFKAALAAIRTGQW